MPTFKAPQYTKIVNPKTGAQEPCYIFNIDFDTGDYLSFVADNKSDISLQSVQQCVLDNIPWWNTFIGQFLESSAKFFSKQYTVETINKITKHSLNGNTNETYPVNVLLVPKNIQICGGVFTINWGYNIEQMIIPDLDNEETLPVLNIEGMEELNIDELPVGNSTEDVLEIDSPTKFYDKQRVKEARLKAKLAVYKAQRQMAQYCEKYGDDISDSDTDYTSEENEEVQI